MRVVLKPWGFDESDIATEVMIWHGRQDHHVPASVAENYAGRIPRCEPMFLEEEGHFSLIERHAERIVRRLIERIAEL